MPTTLLDNGSVRLIRDFIAAPHRLYAELAAEVEWDDRMRARKAASFGAPYNYSGITWPAAPVPAPITRVLERVAKTVGFRPDNCLAHFYLDGASTMGFHSDSIDEIEPGTGIAIVSLGAERCLTFRRGKDKLHQEAYPLPSGSLLVMTGEMQK